MHCHSKFNSDPNSRILDFERHSVRPTPFLAPTMARWPDNPRANFIALLLIFGLLPLLCWFAWWFVKG